MLRYLEELGWEMETERDLKAPFFLDKDTGAVYTREEALEKRFRRTTELFHIVKVKNEN